MRICSQRWRTSGSNSGQSLQIASRVRSESRSSSSSRCTRSSSGTASILEAAACASTAARSTHHRLEMQLYRVWRLPRAGGGGSRAHKSAATAYLSERWPRTRNRNSNPDDVHRVRSKYTRNGKVNGAQAHEPEPNASAGFRQPSKVRLTWHSIPKGSKVDSREHRAHEERRQQKGHDGQRRGDTPVPLHPAQAAISTNPAGRVWIVRLLTEEPPVVIRQGVAVENRLSS